MIRFAQSIRDRAGNVIGSASVTVYLTGTTSKVPVFSNAEGTESLPNPLTSSANGRVAFYADPAVFDFVIEKGYFRDTITGIQVDTLLASELGVNSGALLVGTDNGENLQERIDGIESDIAALDSDKQPLDATLTAIAGVTTEADTLIYADGGDSFATTAFTSAARDLLDDVDAAAMRVTLGANVDVQVHAAAGKSTPVDADELGIVDSAASNVLKKLTWANLKATLKTYLDTLYALTGAVTTSGLTMSTARLLGRSTGSSGAVEEITVGSGLSLSGGTLSASGGGTGDVVGPASATDSRIAAFDGTTGKLLKDGGVVISADGTFASNSDAKVPTEKAVKTYAPTKSQTDEMISGYIGTVADKSYKIIVKASHAGTATETTTISESGTCTATFKVNTTAFGGTANSVSSSEQSQAHASNNAWSAGDDIVITASSNSACLGMSFTIKYTRTLS